jgi:hypothetical protein
VTTATDVELLHRELDDRPGDQTLRLALADALLDGGDDLGLGYQAVAVCGHVPCCLRGDTVWYWWNREEYPEWWPTPNPRYAVELPREDTITAVFAAMVPADWYRAGRPDLRLNSPAAWFRSRRLADDALARGFLKLPPERQQQLLQSLEAVA